MDLSDVKVFGEAVVRNCVIILRKPLSGEKVQTKINVKKVLSPEQAYSLNSLPVTTFSPSFFLSLPKSMYRVSLQKDRNSLLEKIENKSIKVGDICYVNWGARTGDIKKYVVKEPVNEFCKKMVNARNIDRYDINYTNDYLIYKKDELYNPMFEELFESSKIIIRDISGRSRLKATLDNKKYYTEHTVSLAVPYYFLKDVKRRGLFITEEQVNLSKKYDLHFVLALMNSKLANYYFSSKLGGGLHVYPDDVKQLPVYKINLLDKTEKEIYAELIKLVEKMLKLNQDIKGTVENSDNWNSLKSELENTDEKIDDKIYGLYGLTEEEIKNIKN